MLIYILKSFLDERKLKATALIVGYFTNKDALCKTIKRPLNRRGLGIRNNYMLNRCLDEIKYLTEGSTAADKYMDTGAIEVVESNAPFYW